MYFVTAQRSWWCKDTAKPLHESETLAAFKSRCDAETWAEFVSAHSEKGHSVTVATKDRHIRSVYFEGQEMHRWIPIHILSFVAPVMASVTRRYTWQGSRPNQWPPNTPVCMQTATRRFAPFNFKLNMGGNPYTPIKASPMTYYQIAIVCILVLSVLIQGKGSLIKHSI
jgi:hypothetical protein